MPISNQNVSKYAEFDGDLEEFFVTLRQMFKEGAIKVTIKREGPEAFRLYWQ